MEKSSETLNSNILKNPKVQILKKSNGWIKLSPNEVSKEPLNLTNLKSELIKKRSVTGLIDILKETDLRISFDKNFKSFGTCEKIDSNTLQKRLILVMYGFGTNTGLKRVAFSNEEENYKDLQYIKKKFISTENLRNAITDVTNDILDCRNNEIWGDGTSTCASDSKKFISWDQNLMTDRHAGYNGKGIMIYWHVERKSVCIYSQVKKYSSSEVASMIEGLLKHESNSTYRKKFYRLTWAE